MSDFDDDPRIPDAFDRLRSDADSLDVMEPLRSLPATSKRRRNMKLGLLGGAVAAILAVLGVAVFNSNEPTEDLIAADSANTLEGALGLPSDWLQGTDWVLVGGMIGELDVLVIEVGGTDTGVGPDVVVIETQSLLFDGRSIVGGGYCDGFTAAVTVAEGGLVVRDLAPEPSPCDAARLRGEVAAFVNAVNATETIRVDAKASEVHLIGPDSFLTYRAATSRPRTDAGLEVDGVPLDGSVWKLVHGNGPSGPLTIVGATQITVGFSDGNLGGNAGCNGYGGTATIDGNDIVVGEIAQNAAGCDEAVNLAEGAFLAALAGVSHIEVDGNALTLSGDDTVLNFVRSVADPTPPRTLAVERLEGTSWTLVDSWAPPNGSKPVPLVDGWPITISFDGVVVSGTAACNGYGGRLALDGPGLLVADLSWNQAGCQPDVQAAEQAYLELLTSAEGGRFEGDQLVLSSELGELIFDQDDPLELGQIVDRPWNLETAARGDQSFEAESVLYGLEIRADGSLTAILPCRRLDGEYVVSGTAIVPTTLSVSNRTCQATPRVSADIAFSVIESGFIPRISDGKLELTAAGDESLTWIEGEMPSTEPGAAGLALEDLEGTEWRLFEGLIGQTELFGDDSTRLSFSGSTATAGNGCSTVRPNVEIVGGTINWLDAPVPSGCDIDDFLSALTQTTAVSMFANTEPRVLELFGLDIQLNFEEVPDVEGRELSVDELLDLRPTGQVTLLSGSDELLSYGGTTIVCGGDTGALGPTCGGRWVVITNYNSLVDRERPLTGVLRDDGRFQIVGPGSGVPERGSMVEVTDEDRALVDRFRNGFFDGPTFAEQPDPRFGADGLTLWLGGAISEPHSLEELNDNAAWTFDVADFDGLSGPFNIFDVLDQSAVSDLPGETVLAVGPHNHCAGQPLLLPESLQGLRQLSIQPTGIDSCLQWFAVDLFVDDAGVVVAVMLDLWGP